MSQKRSRSYNSPRAISSKFDDMPTSCENKSTKRKRKCNTSRFVNSSHQSTWCLQKLGDHIIEQRTDLEKFFQDALEHVKSQKQVEVESAKRAALEKYSTKLRSILEKKGIGHVPHTTVKPKNSAFKDTTAVKMEDLDWSDKERVLRIMFAKMNGYEFEEASPAKPISARKIDTPNKLPPIEAAVILPVFE